MVDIDLFPLLMRLNKTWALRYEAARRRAIRRYLGRVDPRRLEALGRRGALAAFRQAAKHAPFYNDILEKAGIDPASIRSEGDFSRLPIIDKRIFSEYSILDLTQGHTLDGAKGVLTSSGYSGIFAFGLNSREDLESMARYIDLALDLVMGMSKKKTLLISCLPMGVKVYSNTILLGEVSVREDMALALVQKFGAYYEQLIITGEVFFIKSLIEAGIAQGIEWKSLPINITSGEDSFPENYRDYLAGLVGVDLDARPLRQFIGSSMGVGELALVLFHETPDTVRLRRLAERDESFRRALFGEAPVLPMLFHYYPQSTYLEISEEGELVVTMTSPYLKIPLVRYRPHDQGRIIPHLKLQELLKEYGREDLLPSLHLPLVAVEGRAEIGSGLHPGVVRHALFADHRIAGLITGHFTLVDSGETTRIRLHLKPGVEWREDDSRLIAERVKEAGYGVIIEPVPYYEFTEGLTLDYNKKFNHV